MTNSNISKLPTRQFKLSKFVDDIVAFVKQHQAPEFIKTLIENIKSEDVRTILNDVSLDNVEIRFLRKDDEHKLIGFSFISSIRHNLIPEFGTRDHVAFLTMTWDDVVNDNDIVMKDWPENILVDFERYFKSYPEVPSDLLCFGVNVLKTILTHKQLRYVIFATDDPGQRDGFNLKFKDSSFVYTFKFDFLPLLLDYLATKFYQEKLI